MAAILEIGKSDQNLSQGASSCAPGAQFAGRRGRHLRFCRPQRRRQDRTTIRIIATLLAFEQGDVRLGGYSTRTHPRDVRRLLGYIPDEFGLYDEMSAVEYLEFFAACYGIAPEKRHSIVADLLDLVGLTPRASTKSAPFPVGCASGWDWRGRSSMSTAHPRR